ncbi:MULTISPECIES: carboxypeptidase-like regulatory domain-containing protein [Chryseobacterium]|uniref:Carboxypeptidase regulatory-like domain-containing protein n=1 Tax=Candidatus Chryseobacterium massiliense TaxID=204089 RepID=A0A3D9BI05_9FLAO|nr:MULTISPECIES: carboxypeptidase-like regulatory domain-containing protein [Chryseobacterium]REC53160.1 carboxypeptidase regulatory-like domain-containing protein [Candidatus Chryseobacterium massiliae]
MNFRLVMILLFLFVNGFSQQKISGKITDEDGISLPSVTVMNISADKKTYTGNDGTFSIEIASPDDEIRFVRNGFERSSIKAMYGLNKELNIKLTRIAEDIEEVQVAKITGDLDKDSKAVAKTDKGQIVEDAVGLPQPVGKMREKPAEVKQVLIPILLGSLNVQGLYDLVSGDARRMKRQYRYDDLQEDIAWIRNRVEDEYFTKEGIPAERISEFIEFSFVNKPQTRTFVRAKNLTGALSRMDEAFPVFVKRIEESKNKK